MGKLTLHALDNCTVWLLMAHKAAVLLLELDPGSGHCMAEVHAGRVPKHAESMHMDCLCWVAGGLGGWVAGGLGGDHHPITITACRPPLPNHHPCPTAIIAKPPSMSNYHHC